MIFDRRANLKYEYGNDNSGAKDITQIQLADHSVSLDALMVLGILEENFSEEEGLRILKDDEGTFIVEIGQYDSKAEAEEKLNKLKKNHGEEIKLDIEKRSSKELPKAIK